MIDLLRKFKLVHLAIRRSIQMIVFKFSFFLCHQTMDFLKTLLLQLAMRLNLIIFKVERTINDIIMDGLFSQIFLMGSQQENLPISLRRTTLRAISTVLLSHFVQLNIQKVLPLNYVFQLILQDVTYENTYTSDLSFVVNCFEYIKRDIVFFFSHFSFPQCKHAIIFPNKKVI